METEIKNLLKLGHSDAYIEAVMYGKYKYKYNMKHINNIIKKYRNRK